MPRSKQPKIRIVKREKPFVIGFLPENDCAPLIVAHELGFFVKYGLEVQLQCEMDWRNLHDKLVFRAYDAVHAPAALPFLINLGLTPEKCSCLTGLILSLQGGAITISRKLWHRGVRDAATMGEHMNRNRGKLTFTFGVACPLASHYSLLCQWLRAAEMYESSQVRIVTVPVWQMFPMLKLGYLDGFCAGEPWGSVAVQSGEGVCVATSSALAPLHPEKILCVRKEFANRESERHLRLLAALIEASAFCDQPENRKQVCSLLAQPRYVNAPSDCIEPGLLGPFATEDSQVRSLHGLNIFHRYGANDPTAERENWVTGRLYEFLRWGKKPSALKSVFRRDLFLKARKLTSDTDSSRLRDSEPSENKGNGTE